MIPDKLTKNFSNAACRQLAQAAQFAYCEPSEIKNAAWKAGAIGCEYIENQETDLHCFVANTARDILIAFKGTAPASLKNWITDADFLKRDWYGCRVHRGFANAIDSLWPRLIPNVNAGFKISQAPNVWIVGHSLGGALGLLAAKRLDELGFYIAGVYTFGQPRVGDAAFALQYDSKLAAKTFRVVHEADIVPRLPGPILARYHHAGNEIFLNAFGGVRANPSIPEKLLSGAAEAWFELYAKRDYLKAIEMVLSDHSMSGYMERINN